MMSKKKEKAVRVYVEGRVQGVGFRFFTVRTAEKMGLKGYVRNLLDGRVETYAEGDEETLKQFVSILRKGPLMASVRRIEQEWQDATGSYSNFDIDF